MPERMNILVHLPTDVVLDVSSYRHTPHSYFAAEPDAVDYTGTPMPRPERAHLHLGNDVSVTMTFEQISHLTESLARFVNAHTALELFGPSTEEAEA